MRIYKKVLDIYSKDELIKRFERNTVGRIMRDEENVALNKIVREISFEKLGYTYDDFLVDYHEKYKDHVEKKMIYNVFNAGYNLYSLKKKYNLETQIYNYLKYGFNYEGITRNMHMVMGILGVEIDISKFELHKYSTHIELFGDPEELEKFREKYKIKRKVLHEPYRQQWHLAFSGCLAEYIKMIK